MRHITLVRSLVGLSEDHGLASRQVQAGWASLGAGRHLHGGPIAGDGLVTWTSPKRQRGHAVRETVAPGTVEPQALKRYGDTAFGRAALRARQLVENGVPFVQIHRGGFDTHFNNFPTMAAHGEVMDPALAALIRDLAQSGLLSTTLVVALSEFGRTPQINNQAGRDHHPGVFSCLLAGAGVQGGRVIGSSDRDGYLPRDRPVRLPDLHETIHDALGLDPGPLRAREVAPVLELFA
jgi:hypothetical protein